jgi:hypothetical protein
MRRRSGEKLAPARREAKREAGRKPGELTLKRAVRAEMEKMATKSFRRMFATWIAGAAISALAITSGCLAVAVGAGAGAAVAYVRGELRATVSGGYDATAAAADGAVQDLKFVKVSERRDALTDIIVARTAADKKVEIKVEHLTQEATTVKIRVGLIGDESLSIAILEKIKARL